MKTPECFFIIIIGQAISSGKEFNQLLARNVAEDMVNLL